MNDVKLLGRLAADPELRYTTSGTPVASFDLAVSRPAGDGQKATDFFPIVAWRNRAEFAAQYLTKGRQIVVDGTLRTRKWQDKDGNNRKIIEVVAENIYFADSNRGDGHASPLHRFRMASRRFRTPMTICRSNATAGRPPVDRRATGKRPSTERRIRPWHGSKFIKHSKITANF
ncbi:single-stranded DNA-binding protein [Tepidibacillus marianensis]|uniref:single-stranded DNA-binding protein n=1 Tax=Tepidibacillus marianensis TaxID=3131995 RepID=UPI0030CD3CBC